MSVGFFEIVFACNARATLEECEESRYEEICSECCSEFKKCFDHKPNIMWGAMASFDDILRCVEKWRLYNEQTVKQ